MSPLSHNISKESIPNRGQYANLAASSPAGVDNSFLTFAAKHDFALFPMPYGSKAPFGIIASFAHDFSRSPEQWQAWRAAHKCNFGIVAGPSRIIAVDVDVAEAGETVAWQYWSEWCTSRGLPAYAPYCRSARGGWHIAFQLPADFDLTTLRQVPLIGPIEGVSKKAIIDLRVGNGFVVAPESFYNGIAKGEASGMYRLLPDAQAHPAPDALLAACARAPRTGATARASTADANDTQKVLEWMAEHDCFASYHAWLEAGLILRAEFGDDPGFSLWQITNDGTCSAEPEAAKWQSFSAEPSADGVGIGTLRKRAKDAGCPHFIGTSAAAMFDGVAQMVASIPSPPLAPTAQNAATLLARSFAPVRYVIPGYIAEGCSILAGKPKIGKSWFVLDAALAVAGGNSGRAFGVQAESGNVLYLALEDNERRLKSRIRKVLGPFEGGPERFEYRTEWPRADEGGLDAIETWIKSVPKATLVIVDVLARFRPMATGRNTAAYDADYAAISGLQGLASKYSVAIVIVHHLRKNAADNDPFDKVSGTLGLSGAADTILIIDREGQGIVLYGRGRDIEEIETAITFEKSSCRWRVMGSASEVRMSGARKTILEVLKGSSTAMSPADIAAETGMRPANVRQLLPKLVKEGGAMKAERGKYVLGLVPPITTITTDTTVSVDHKITTALLPPLPG